MPKKIEGEEFETVLQRGREFASHLLSDAVEKSPNSEEITDRVVLLQMMAVSLLATTVMNGEVNSHANGDVLLERVFTNIRAEYAFMKTELAEGRLEHVKTEIPRKYELH